MQIRILYLQILSSFVGPSKQLYVRDFTHSLDTKGNEMKDEIMTTLQILK